MKIKKLKPKLLILAVFILFNVFLSGTVGVVNIEKMAIITAIGIDMDNEEYSITAQIAVPEEDSTSTEKKKTHLEGKGKTVGDAIKSISDISGWYPQLVFCNLIVVGKDFKDKNVLTVLDFFSKTLRVQDSAQVVFTEEETARELLSESSPMDNISSFAIQKILHKKEGFNKDVAEINIKDFCSDYYSRTSSSFMPIIKTIKQEESKSESSSNGGSGSGNKMGGMETGGKTPESGGNSLFDAKNTAMFKNGILVGTLTEEETATFNLLTESSKETTLTVSNVKENLTEKCNYLVTILKNKRKVKLSVDEKKINLDINLHIFCKVSDQNSKTSTIVASKNNPLQSEIKIALEEKIKNDIQSLIQKIKSTDCDILKLDEMLYRYNHKYYPTHKDKLLEKMQLNLNVTVTGQK